MLKKKKKKKKIKKKNPIIINENENYEDSSNRCDYSNSNSNKFINQIKSDVTKKNPIININNIFIINNNKNDTEKTKMEKPTMELNDNEINKLEYSEALIHDKRTYFQYYFSLLKTKHLLFFSFYPMEDYNSRVIKAYLFFFSFNIYLSVNALFFSDSTMHKIYQDGGKFNLIYQIPQIIYSSVISAILNAVIKALSLSERNFLQIKHEENLDNLKDKGEKIIKYIFYKLIIFFIFSFLLLLTCLYYLGCFCVVYKNTQIHLLKDSCISFSFSLLYPLGIYLIHGVFRIPSLRATKQNKKFMYKFSLILQLI